MSVTSRRTPVQGRSQETVQKVLAATADLLAGGQPVDHLTTAAIAASAGVSVGALYRFFPDKQAIVDAIALKHMETFQEALSTRLMLAFPASPQDFLAAVIDGFADYLVAHPDFRTIAFGHGGAGRTISRATRDAYAASGEVADLVRSFLAEVFGIAVTEDFDFRLRLAIEAGDRLLGFAFEQASEAARRRVIAETKRILNLTLFERVE